MTTATTPAPPYVSGSPAPHSHVENVVGVLTGAVLASLGLFLLNAAGAVTGGTAGLSLLIGHVLTGTSFGAVFVVVNLPFIVLAAVRKGRSFAVRSVAAVALVSGLSFVHAHALVVTHVSPIYGALVGNLALGLGILIVFRHGSSLGGFNVVALLAQERRGWRAGHVQLALDGSVIAASSVTMSGPTLAYSAAGAIVLNLVLAMNHRPGRYLGA